MSDISKCTGILEDNLICPLRETCLRYTIKDNKIMQLYMHTPGYYKNGKFVCNLKWIQDDK